MNFTAYELSKNKKKYLAEFFKNREPAPDVSVKIVPAADSGENKRRRWWADDIARIMELRAGGMQLNEIAAEYGVKYQTLQKMLQNAKNRGFDAFPVNDEI